MDTGILNTNENLHTNLRTLANIRMNLISPETRVHVEVSEELLNVYNDRMSTYAVG